MNLQIVPREKVPAVSILKRESEQPALFHLRVFPMVHFSKPYLPWRASA